MNPDESKAHESERRITYMLSGPYMKASKAKTLKTSSQAYTLSGILTAGKIKQPLLSNSKGMS